jgi:hypothetical protein
LAQTASSVLPEGQHHYIMAAFDFCIVVHHTSGYSILTLSPNLSHSRY